MNAVLAITDPGDEIVLLVPYYFNHEMAVVMAGAQRRRGADDERLPARRPRDRGGDHAAHAGGRDRVAEQSDRRGLSRGGAARGQRACRDRGIFHIHDEAYEYFTYGGVQHFSPGSLAGRRRPHDLALLAVEGVWHGELADRLHGDSGRAARSGQQDSGHDPDLPAGRLAARRDRRARRRPLIRRRASRAAGSRRGTRSSKR